MKSLKTKTTENPVILAIYPNAQGFSFACMDSPENERRSGIHRFDPVDNYKCLKKSIAYLNYYCPDVIILENPISLASRKNTRVRTLIKLIAQHSRDRNIQVMWYTREEIRNIFELFGVHTKYGIAMKIAEWLPVHKSKLPKRPRKNCDPDGYYMAIFSAFSLIYTYYYLN